MPNFTASTMQRAAGATLILRGAEAPNGHNAFYRYFVGGRGFDFPIRPGSGVVVASPSEQTVAIDVPEPLRAGIITTVAGTGVPGYSGDGGLATAAQLDYPGDVVFDRAGDMWVADSHNLRIRKVDHSTGIITTYAGRMLVDSFGNGISSGDGGPAADATFACVCGLQFDGQGNMYVEDQRAYRVVSAASGVITSMTQSYPSSRRLVVTPDGTLYFSSDQNPPGLFRKSPGQPPVALYSYSFTTLAGGDAKTLVVAGDNSGSLYEFELATGQVTTLAGTRSGFSVDGLHALDTSFFDPWHVELDRERNLYISDWKTHRIRRYDRKTQAITTVAGDGFAEWRGPSNVGGRYNGDGVAATEASLNQPGGIRFGPDGALYIADAGNHRIRRVSAEPAPPSTSERRLVQLGTGISLFSVPYRPAETGTVLASQIAALTGSPFVVRSVVVQGNARWQVYLAELATQDFVLEPTQGCLVQSYIPRTVDFTDGAEIRPGDVVTIAGKGLRGCGPDGLNPLLTELNQPYGLAFDSHGRLVFADAWNGRIRRLDLQTRELRTLLGEHDCGGDNSQGPPRYPYTMCLDRGDNVHFFDTFRHEIDRLDIATGTVTTEVTGLDDVKNMTASPEGELFYYDIGNSTVFVLSTGATTPTTVFGHDPHQGPMPRTTGTASFEVAVFDNVIGLAYVEPRKLRFLNYGQVFEADLKDRIVRPVSTSTRSIIRASMLYPLSATSSLVRLDDGSFVVSDPWKNRIVRLTPSGEDTLFAGDSWTPDPFISAYVGGRLAGDGGPALLASFNFPTRMAVGPSGDIYIADTENHVIRKIRNPLAFRGSP